MSRIHARLSLLLGLWGAVACPAWAAEAPTAYVGKVLKGVGEARIVDGKGLSRKAVEGSYFYLADTIMTGSTGRVKLLFNERSSIVVVGANSVLLVEKASGGGEAKRIGTRIGLRRGEVRVSIEPGSYSGRAEEVFEVKTPNAVAGVRGTVFLVGYDAKAQSTLLATESGRVSFSSGDSQTYVEGGRFSRANGGLVSNPENTPKGGQIEQRLRKLEREAAEDEQASDESDADGRSPASAKPASNAKGQALGGLAQKPVVPGPGDVREQQLYRPEVAADVLKRGEGILDRVNETQQNNFADQPTPKGEVAIPIVDQPPNSGDQGPAP